MLDSILTSPVSGMAGATLLCLGASLLIGAVIALVHMFQYQSSRSFAVTLALLPAMVQSVILLVNGNLGVGVAVMGAFGLVRFRSLPGSASEIASLFFAMAAGLATGMGFVGYAAIFTAVISAMTMLYHTIHFGEKRDTGRTLSIVIPEDLDYAGLFDDLFAEYTKQATLDRVRTTNLGSLYELRYTIALKEEQREKELIDKLRQRNGNLNISCGRIAVGREEL